jgi:hypothetical protein
LKVSRLGHFIHALVHRLDHGGRQRFGHVADAAADDARGLVRVCLAVGFHPAGDFGKQVTGFEFEEIRVDGCHGVERAARAAEVEFPFVADIRSGVVRYLETRCPLKLMPIGDLYDRMRKMLVKIGCERIADHLQPLAPPVTVSLLQAAREAGCGFELGFFEALRSELSALREAGVEDIRFTGLREAILELSGALAWNAPCDQLLREIEAFLEGWRDMETEVLCAME